MYIRYRKDGNCFPNCVVMGCNLFGDNINALDIFSIEILYGNPDHEFEPTLNYLINNDYDILVYDPDPKNWGKNISHKSVQLENRVYEIDDIDLLSKNGWCIIPCSLDNRSKPIHAVIIYKNKLRDPIDEREWCKNRNIENFKDRYFPVEELKRFLIAFRKQANPLQDKKYKTGL